MSQVRYKKIFEDTWKSNEKLFQKFFLLNSEYIDPKNRQHLEQEFQEVGKKVQNLLKEGENELCRHMEKSEHRVFSSKLADKYWDEVRKYFKYIDLVGVVTRRA
ncbi:hypothetical protein JW766_06040 [Candidatus Dojkabacteria bacterium]|nr:hypothetical protein [Candidatus Dojkabacteria bacterium]